MRTGGGKYLATPYQAWRLSSKMPARRHHLRLVTHIAQSSSLEEWQAGLRGLWNDSAGDPQPARRAAHAWWAAFWDRSWIAIDPDHPDPGSKPWRAARNYTLFRFQLGCNARGEYPTMFNGGNLVFDPCLVTSNRTYPPDWRNWGGGVFTAQNQRLLHWPKECDVDFKLHAPGQTTVKGRLRGGRLTDLEVAPPERRKDVVLAAPFTL